MTSLNEITFVPTVYGVLSILHTFKVLTGDIKEKKFYKYKTKAFTIKELRYKLCHPSHPIHCCCI